MIKAMKYLELFLPVAVKPSEADISYMLWFEEFMNLWTVCHDACSWENVSVHIDFDLIRRTLPTLIVNAYNLPSK